MTRDEMFTLIIQKFGFEHEVTIEFAKMMETLSDSQLSLALATFMAMPITDKENE